jgi:hypothetical protein
MSCFRDQSGRPLCHIVDHPDRPDYRFCSTCRRQFQDLPQSDSFQRRSDTSGQLPKAVVDVITGILALFLAAIVSSIGKNSPPSQPPPPPLQPSAHSDPLTRYG